MNSGSLQGGFSDAPIQSAFAFRAILNALARPGTLETLAGARPPAPLSEAAGTLLLTLCDPSTPMYLAESHDNSEVRGWITFHCGAPLVEAEAALFAVGTWDALQPVSRFAIGEPDYPDRAATLVIEMPKLDPSGARLVGPGISGSARLSLPETEAFACNRGLFPMGFDCFLTAGDRIAGLPRSTKVEAV